MFSIPQTRCGVKFLNLSIKRMSRKCHSPKKKQVRQLAVVSSLRGDNWHSQDYQLHGKSHSNTISSLEYYAQLMQDQYLSLSLRNNLNKNVSSFFCFWFWFLKTNRYSTPNCCFCLLSHQLNSQCLLHKINKNKCQVNTNPFNFGQELYQQLQTNKIRIYGIVGF